MFITRSPERMSGSMRLYSSQSLCFASSLGAVPETWSTSPSSETCRSPTPFCPARSKSDWYLSLTDIRLLLLLIVELVHDALRARLVGGLHRVLPLRLRHVALEGDDALLDFDRHARHSGLREHRLCLVLDGRVLRRRDWRRRGRWRGRCGIHVVRRVCVVPVIFAAARRRA